ncbi:MAG: methyltransferase domain-containing protein [Actinomycetota bacterium]|nr:methyltransferase domain-containing protein [Actinomycetota bacterium]
MSLRQSVPGLVRRGVNRLPDDMRKELGRRASELKGIGQLKANQALLAKRLADLEARELGARPAPPDVVDDRFPPGVRSRICTQAQLAEPWFDAWSRELREPAYAHRKSWEFTYIAEVLQAMGQLQPGRRGLGFGVGREPLVAALANRGVSILATDLDPEAKEARAWLRTDQHADNIEAMSRPEVCDPAKFRELVDWRAVDMRAIPSDLRGFDFCWSACALEHLGTLEEGMRFVEQSLETLVPGGIAVHTTEYNLYSNDSTIESGPVVVYRQRDLEELRTRLEGQGHELAAYDLAPGDGLLDHYVDLPPYAEEPCLRFLFGSYTLTSVALVIRTRAS